MDDNEKRTKCVFMELVLGLGSSLWCLSCRVTSKYYNSFLIMYLERFRTVFNQLFESSNNLNLFNLTQCGLNSDSQVTSKPRGF